MLSPQQPFLCVWSKAEMNNDLTLSILVSAKSLGEQCFYRQACKYMDAHASCIQINHNAICQCESGFHSVSYSKPVRKVFCTEGMQEYVTGVKTWGSNEDIQQTWCFFNIRLFILNIRSWIFGTLVPSVIIPSGYVVAHSVSCSIYLWVIRWSCGLSSLCKWSLSICDLWYYKEADFFI